MKQRQWKSAQTAFQAALKLIPNDHRTRMRLEMCGRRLHPQLPGFTLAAEDFHAPTGLPRRVAVAGLKTPMLLVPAGEFDLGSDDLAVRFNPHWGSFFKQGAIKTRFASQLETYSCLYTSRVSNFLFYGSQHYYRVVDDPMVHE